MCTCGWLPWDLQHHHDDDDHDGDDDDDDVDDDCGDNEDDGDEIGMMMTVTMVTRKSIVGVAVTTVRQR